MLDNNNIVMGNKRAVICANGALKGGANKSTCNAMLADYLYNEKGYNVCLIDADDDQKTITEWRKVDVLYEEDEDKLYPILSNVNSSDLPSHLEYLSASYDYIIIDLPGNMKQAGVKTNYAYIDVIFVPTQADMTTLSSHIRFLNALDEIKLHRREILKQNDIVAYGFLSNVDPRMTNVKSMINKLETGFDDRLPMLNNLIPTMKAEYATNITSLGYRKDSTHGQKIKLLCEEMHEVLINTKVKEYGQV